MRTSNRWWLSLLDAAAILSSTGILAFSTGTSCNVGFFGDGDCDSVNNNEECGYDSGDCCPCTCEDNSYTCGVNGFDCIDPDALCPLTPAPSNWAYTSTFGCNLNFLADGFCDAANNNEDCGYDSGDCCDCTCEDALYTCGVNGFNCIDPDALCPPSPAPSFGTYTTSSGCNLNFLADGFCDLVNNNEYCGYDSGDCCACTCEDAIYTCGANGFYCIDPDALCPSTPAPSYGIATSGCDVNLLADGLCDPGNNNEDCGYDSGDCCACTCEDTIYFACGDFDCIDPEASCVSPGSLSSTAETFEAKLKSLAIPIAIITLLNLAYLSCWGKGKTRNVIHSYLLLSSFAFSVVEGLLIFFLVPSSKEGRKIAAVFLFGMVAAISSLILRRAGKYFAAAAANAVLEGAFVVVALAFFVEPSSENKIWFGLIATNESLAGFAMRFRVDPPPPDEPESLMVTGFEIGKLVFEAVSDAIFPITAAFTQSWFHPESRWRSDSVATVWAISGLCFTSATFMSLSHPMKNIWFGAKVFCLSGCLTFMVSGVLAFVILGYTRAEIADPPTVDVALSAFWGASGLVLGICFGVLTMNAMDHENGENLAIPQIAPTGQNSNDSAAPSAQ